MGGKLEGGPALADQNLVPLSPAGTLLVSERFQRLADVPPEAQWFANLDGAQTRRAYKNDLQAFMTFTGIAQPEEFRSVTRGHILAWRVDLESQKLAGSTIRRKLVALASHYEYTRSFTVSSPRQGGASSALKQAISGALVSEQALSL